MLWGSDNACQAFLDCFSGGWIPFWGDRDKSEKDDSRVTPAFEAEKKRYDTFENVPGHAFTETMQRSGIPKASFRARYRIEDVIGTGSSSTCYDCTRIGDGKRFAVKVVDFLKLEKVYPKRTLKKLRREVYALRKLEHENIVKMEDFFFSENKLYIVQENLSGGELHDYIVQQRGIVEGNCRIVFRQLAAALDYMHRMNIVHRDVKPENVLFSRKGSSTVKLIDFGYSKLLRDKHASSFLGTGGFLAPEIRLKVGETDYGTTKLQYTKSIDVWALGCLLYVMISSNMPFGNSLFERPKNDFVLFFEPTETWTKVSEEAKDLIRLMLNPCALERITMDDVLRHPWLKVPCKHSDNKTIRSKASRVVSNGRFTPEENSDRTNRLNDSPHHSEKFTFNKKENEGRGFGNRCWYVGSMEEEKTEYHRVTPVSTKLTQESWLVQQVL